jgi:hypothetical protein
MKFYTVREDIRTKRAKKTPKTSVELWTKRKKS